MVRRSILATFPAAMLAAACLTALAADTNMSSLSSEALTRWGRAQYVFTAKLETLEAAPVGQSFPPMYTHSLHFVVDEVLRGPIRSGDRLSCFHVARQRQRPTFPLGKTCLVAARENRGRLHAAVVRPADPEGNLAQARLACSIPIGWSVEQGKLVSPWASLGKAAWPADQRAAGTLACAKTGRPVLSAGGAVKVEVAAVPPKQQIKWTNPDGDGEYRITVGNPTDKPLSVPALLSDGNNILWTESLLILCQGKAYACPGARGVTAKTRPTTLAAGQSVSTVVNVLKLEGPAWPRGGYRIEFQFGLAERSNVQSFYYMSRHHDRLRQQARAGAE